MKDHQKKHGNLVRTEYDPTEGVNNQNKLSPKPNYKKLGLGGEKEKEKEKEKNNRMQHLVVRRSMPPPYKTRESSMRSVWSGFKTELEEFHTSEGGGRRSHVSKFSSASRNENLLSPSTKSKNTSDNNMYVYAFEPAPVNFEYVDVQEKKVRSGIGTLNSLGLNKISSLKSSRRMGSERSSKSVRSQLSGKLLAVPGTSSAQNSPKQKQSKRSFNKTSSNVRSHASSILGGGKRNIVRLMSKGVWVIQKLAPSVCEVTFIHNLHDSGGALVPAQIANKVMTSR